MAHGIDAQQLGAGCMIRNDGSVGVSHDRYVLHSYRFVSSHSSAGSNAVCGGEQVNDSQA